MTKATALDTAISELELAAQRYLQQAQANSAHGMKLHEELCREKASKCRQAIDVLQMLMIM